MHFLPIFGQTKNYFSYPNGKKASITVWDMSWKCEQKILKNKESISLLVTTKIQKARTEIIEI